MVNRGILYSQHRDLARGEYWNARASLLTDRWNLHILYTLGVNGTPDNRPVDEYSFPTAAGFLSAVPIGRIFDNAQYHFGPAAAHSDCWRRMRLLFLLCPGIRVVYLRFLFFLLLSPLSDTTRTAVLYGFFLDLISSHVWRAGLCLWWWQEFSAKCRAFLF